MRRRCVVGLLLAIAATSGCYRSHQRGERDATVDATLPDAGVPHDATRDDAAVPDAAVPDDATLPDAAVPDAAVPDAAVPDAFVDDAHVDPPDSAPPIDAALPVDAGEPDAWISPCPAPPACASDVPTYFLSEVADGVGDDECVVTEEVRLDNFRPRAFGCGDDARRARVVRCVGDRTTIRAIVTESSGSSWFGLGEIPDETTSCTCEERGFGVWDVGTWPLYSPSSASTFEVVLRGWETTLRLEICAVRDP